MKAARNQFYVPAELKIIVIAPELYNRELLRLDGSYRIKEEGGVMSPCPNCQTNVGMRITGWTSARKNCQRVINTKLSHDIIIGATYKCTFIDATNNKCNKTFTAYDGKLWQQFPKAVKRKYQDYVSVFVDRTTNQMLSPGFCDQLLFYKGSFEDMSRRLANSIANLANEATAMYRNFTEEEADLFPPELPKSMTPEEYANKKSQKWPPFNAEKSFSGYFKMPTRPTVTKMFEELYMTELNLSCLEIS
ncbi:hypothetical protein SEMRO_3690_G350330.1 [Seminavis robusta]|uniref:Uncharacterized protein n=1 Tax=Seminavis robusta TaxID=568900 RepID=A0A9N8F2N5_9STRA|nr:hypothetical protein SEMRO_3690_G350330.1 [Seminavis robusta]|eukprot:Sro3690_g350330.1 n/a (248) ;mRNA; f:3293-4036